VQKHRPRGYTMKRPCRWHAIRSQCTGNQFRPVSRIENEAVLDRMQARIVQRAERSTAELAEARA
jgi:hypothetical protein